jgi:TPR repeat protein
MSSPYRLAADKGHAQAHFNLGVYYANGTGVANDKLEAVKWWGLATDHGNADAVAALRPRGMWYATIAVFMFAGRGQ